MGELILNVTLAGMPISIVLNSWRTGRLFAEGFDETGKPSPPRYRPRRRGR